MYLSVISNIINVIGNLIGVLVLRAGVAGVAYPSLIARTFSAVMITVLSVSYTHLAVYGVVSEPLPGRNGGASDRPDRLRLFRGREKFPQPDAAFRCAGGRHAAE